MGGSTTGRIRGLSYMGRDTGSRSGGTSAGVTIISSPEAIGSMSMGRAVDWDSPPRGDGSACVSFFNGAGTASGLLPIRGGKTGASLPIGGGITGGLSPIRGGITDGPSPIWGGIASGLSPIRGSITGGPSPLRDGIAGGPSLIGGCMTGGIAGGPSPIGGGLDDGPSPTDTAGSGRGYLGALRSCSCLIGGPTC